MPSRKSRAPSDRYMPGPELGERTGHLEKNIMVQQSKRPGGCLIWREPGLCHTGALSLPLVGMKQMHQLCRQGEASRIDATQQYSDFQLLFQSSEMQVAHLQGAKPQISQKHSQIDATGHASYEEGAYEVRRWRVEAVGRGVRGQRHPRLFWDTSRRRDRRKVWCRIVILGPSLLCSIDLFTGVLL